MIMLLYGVGESSELIASLKKLGYPVLAVVRRDYDGHPAVLSGADQVVAAPARPAEIHRLIRRLGISQVIDATHPFASPLSLVTREVSAQAGIPYLRFGRGETDLPEDALIHRVHSWEEAAGAAAGFDGVVFLTTGSYNLEIFTQFPGLRGRRMVVRVLPDHRVVKRCQELGISPRDIVAMQGPFSVKLNKIIFQSYRAGVLVTRDGGPSGGAYNKVRAALDLKLPVILIQREKHPDPDCFVDPGLLLEAVKRNNRAMSHGAGSVGE